MCVDNIITAKTQYIKDTVPQRHSTSKIRYREDTVHQRYGTPKGVSWMHPPLWGGGYLKNCVP